jgi:hypothetical protein
VGLVHVRRLRLGDLPDLRVHRHHLGRLAVHPVGSALPRVRCRAVPPRTLVVREGSLKS